MSRDKANINFSLIYHNTIINICEALISAPESFLAEPPLDNPLAFQAFSKICLETVVRLYYLRHGFERADVFLVQSLAVLAYISVGQIDFLASSKSSSVEDIEAAQSTLVLAAKGLHDQGRNYYVHHTVFHLILNSMRSQEVSIMHRFTNVEVEDIVADQLRAKHISAQYPIKVLNIRDDPEQKRLDNLVNEYASLALEAQSSIDESGAESSS